MHVGMAFSACVFCVKIEKSELVSFLLGSIDSLMFEVCGKTILSGV